MRGGENLTTIGGNLHFAVGSANEAGVLAGPVLLQAWATPHPLQKELEGV